MKRLRFLPLFFSLLAVAPLGLRAAAPAPAAASAELVKLDAAKWPASGSAAAPGSFAGTTGGALLVFGGEPAAAEARVLPLAAGASWQSVPAPFARAWGAVAQGSDFLIAVGGIQDGQTSASVDRLAWSGGKLVHTPLPALPVPLAGAGAALIKQKLYVTGGLRALDADRAENALYVLDLAATTPAWRELEPLPGPGRFLATVTAQYDFLQVFGGREVVPAAEGSRTYRATAETWFYRAVPLEATVRRGWIPAVPAPAPIAAAAASPTGQAHVYVLGGDETPLVTSPFALDASATAHPVRLFHVITDAWVDTGVALPGVRPVAVPGPDASTVVFAADGSTSVSALTAIRRVRDLAIIDYVVIIAYFGLLGGIGWYFSHQKESSSEYSLGGRKVQWWAAGISMFATGASAISFMAIPALAFATNLVWTLPILIYVAGYFVQAYIIFPLLRRLQITSTYEYLEQRFNVPLRLIASGQAILFLTFGRAAVVLVLPAIAIAITTGLNVFVSVLVMGALTTVYTAIGGYKAVIWTEVFQGILKFLAPIAMIGVVIWALPGGVKEFISVGKEYHKFDIALLTWDVTVPALWIMVLGAFISCTVSLAGDQPMIQRVFSAPEHEVRRVAFMNVLCGILISFVVNILGLAIFAFFRAHPGLLDAGTQNDQIVPLFATQGLPAGLAGVVIAAIFASAMATVASNMNSVSTLFVEDFYVRWRPAAPDARRLFVLKFSAYLVGAIGTIMALLLAALPIKSMMVVWSQVSALLGGGIVGVYTLGMLTTRANGVGAVTGAIASVIVALLIKLFTPLHWSTYLPVAIGSCLVVGYVVSLATGGSRKDLTGLTVFTPRKPDPVPGTP
ncbi:MAG: sodium/solute symporter [Opitutaceae bacterium]|nr:sodium/solute symporter [Opitutaceae bacterium]